MYTNGKVQVQRVVHRAGKTFTQMFWVNPSEVKSTDKVITPESEQSKPTLFFMDDLTRIANAQGREAALAAAQAFGIVWKHSDNPGINWMRCSMAVKKASGMQSSNQPSGNVDTSNKSSVITPELAAQVNAAGTSKQKIAILVSAMGRGGVMQWAKDNNITWKESDNPGINWMRCSMALREVFPDKAYTSEPVSTDTPSEHTTDTTSNSVDSPLTESKPESTVKTYTPPVMQNHVYMDTPLNKALEAYYNGDYTEKQTREVMHKAMQDMGVTLDSLISDWDNIPMEGICTLGEALSAVRDEFPQIGKGHIYVENTAELKKKHLSSYMTRHPGSHNPFIGYATLAPIAFSKTGEVYSGDNFYVENGNVDSEWGVSFCSDKGYDIADITHDDVIDKGHIQFDACHELTHIVQYEMGRMVLRSMISTASEDNAVRWNNSRNIHKYTEKACELVLRNAIKYLPPEEQAKAKRKRTGKGLAEVFSPTSYGCTNELECIAEAMACHYTGSPRKNDSRKRCEMVYISLREIFDRLLDDPASVKADLDKLKG